MKRLTVNLVQNVNPMNNPIIVKELRSRMRGPRAFITLTIALVFMSLVSFGFYQIVMVTSSWSYSPLSPQIGQTIFSALAVLEMLMICLITPAVTAGAISNEHEKQTYEMLLTTPLNPTRILWGKLISALSYIFLLVFAVIPISSLVFIYGGVAPRDMLKALVVLICTAIMLGTIGIFMSTWFKRSGRATIASYVIVLGLLGAPTIIYGIVGVLQQAEPPRWLLVPSPLNALFSAIAPSTSLGNTSFSMLGSIGMLLGGNIGSMIRADSIPRPLYHYTLPLYGLITLVLYLLSTRLIRPARRWQLRPKDLILGLATILMFSGTVALAFLSSTNRYENVSIFSVPTPVNSKLIESRVIPAVPVPVDSSEDAITKEETTAIYAAVIREAYNQDLIPNLPTINITQQIYSDPVNPVEDQKDNTILSDEVQEGVKSLVEDLPFTIFWQDSLTEFSSNEDESVLLIFSKPTIKKPDFIQVTINIQRTGNQPNQILIFNTFYTDGLWKAQLENISDISIAYPAPPDANNDSLTLTYDEIASIYAAAILQAYTIDTPLPGVEVNQLFLVQSTELDTAPVILPPDIRNKINDSLAYMPFTIKWIEDPEVVLDNEDDHLVAIITFGNISHKNDGSVEVMIDFFFSENDRNLVTYILEKFNDTWQITEFGGHG